MDILQAQCWGHMGPWEPRFPGEHDWLAPTLLPAATYGRKKNPRNNHEDT